MEECPRCADYTGKEPARINWIQCSKCSTWYHNHCISLSLLSSSRISHYHCSSCSPVYGPSLMKRMSKRSRKKIDYVALDQGDVERIDLEEHPHIKQFKNWQGDVDVECVEGDELLDKGREHGFAKPVKVMSCDSNGLGLHIPEFKLEMLIDQLGEDYPIEIMDVLTQNSMKPSWTLGEWIDYFQNTPENRERILNVLSLEISHCELGKQIQRPKFVEFVDLVDKVWPFDPSLPKPKVSKYCLMGIKNSYTDFHLDFAGTSVYYTILSGLKQFIFYPPTKLNLKKYTTWLNDSILQNEFLGNLGLENGIKVEIYKGDTLIIPSGWIHAVFTPRDSIVIGGNFLTSFNLDQQFEIIKVEDQTGVDKKFKYPNFNKLMWFTGWKWIQGGIELNSTQVEVLKNWMEKKIDYPGRYIGMKIDEFMKLMDKKMNE